MCEIPKLFQSNYLLFTSHDSQQEIKDSLELLSQYTQSLLNKNADSQDSLAQFMQQDLPMLNVLAVDSTENNDNITEIDQQQNRNFENEEKYEIVSDLELHSWKQLDHYISVHAKQNGFVAIITELKFDAITRRRCRYTCEHQGKSNSKKTAILEQQKQSHTKCLGCKWIVNITCPKTTGKIKINSCHLEHNYEIHLDTIIFAPHYRQFSKEVNQDIEYYTSKGLNMRMQHSLLEDKYLDTLFLLQALSLTIQSFKQHSKVVNEASTLLEMLLNKKAQDQNW
ncbi:12354_t:CDS:1, partial [Dentiscutata erythropus]